MIQTTTYNRKPLTVEAVQVTDDNKEAIAEWCGGKILPHEHNGKMFVEIQVLHPLHKKQTRAFTSDWVLKSGQGYKIYSENAFLKGFEKAALSGAELEGPLAGVHVIPAQLSFQS